MLRNLCTLRKIVLPSLYYSRYTMRESVAISMVRLASSCSLETPVRPKVWSITVSGVSVSDINIYDLAKDDIEFARNFTTSLSSLGIPPASEPNQAADPEVPSNESAVTDSDAGEGDINGGACSVLDKDGLPIVPLDIDGWSDFNEDEEVVTVQQTNRDMEVGSDEEYKTQQNLVVPEQHEAQFEYKGIKIKLPETMQKQKGTYRFRRDPEDFEMVADDIRLCKFEKK